MCEGKLSMKWPKKSPKDEGPTFPLEQICWATLCARKEVGGPGAQGGASTGSGVQGEEGGNAAGGNNKTIYTCQKHAYT